MIKTQWFTVVLPFFDLLLHWKHPFLTFLECVGDLQFAKIVFQNIYCYIYKGYSGMYGTKTYGHSTPMSWSRWLAVAALFLLSTCLVWTLERAQEPGKAAPSAQRTMDPEIPLSWEFNWLLNTLPVSVRELSSFRTAPQAKNLYVQLPKRLRKHCFELPKSHCGSLNR